MEMGDEVVMNESNQKSERFKDAVPFCFNEDNEEMYEVE